MTLSENQEKIIKTQGNLIVRASAGTGKTTTMVSKIAFDIQNNYNHKVIAAITFTIKASREIKNKLTIDVNRHFIGTNNSFAVEEIIKPFIKDVYGIEFASDMSTDYSIKVENYEKGIERIKIEKILPTYKDCKKNFIFQLALYILKNSKACKLYIQAKYFKLYIDEYQDCDKDMHEFFMFICEELKIDIFVVGDEKQSIYIWRGAHPASFLSILVNPKFKKEILMDNFRSCLQIQNYSNLLCSATRSFYKKDLDLKSILLINTTQNDWNKEIIKYLDLTKKTALLCYKNKDAEEYTKLLNNINTKLKFIYIPQIPIASITTAIAWLYNAIANYFIIEKYSIYDFLIEVPEESIDNNKILPYINSILKDLQKYLENNDSKNFIIQTRLLAEYFGYETKESDIIKLYITIRKVDYHPAFEIEQHDNIATTFHSAKGLEFDQVIIFAKDYNLADNTGIYNHYVAATRAKTKLIIIKLDEYYSEKFIKNLNSILNESKLEINDIVTVI